MREKVAIIGAGKWGQALNFALLQKCDVVISSRTPKPIENFVTLEEASRQKYLVIAIPAQFVGQWLSNHFTYNDQNVMVAAKGIEAKSGKFLNEIYAPFVPEEKIAFLSGPSFAAEVIQALPTAVVVNSTNEALAARYASFFPDFMRTYTSKDVMGAEIAGAYKNVIAIAAGICEGLKLGKNAAAALISRGLVEMRRFGAHFGGEDETFLGLSGAGDLFLTASSVLSRNYRVGLGLAAHKQLSVINEELKEVAEGVGTTYALHKIASEHALYLPIAQEVYEILEGKNPQQSIKDLLEK